jgi:hypothetical protein
LPKTLNNTALSTNFGKSVIGLGFTEASLELLYLPELRKIENVRWKG